ncbi:MULTISPECIES: bifunctional sugar phosphate isomerase/epimerase/4-hydroxyphenylpyruvate dioxygenase family protein [unclassified Serratia (in: enterobacteria)]|uniref:bifunctional sugar phosphate isomerase/epimerase/4-hydroxyphenylpyruvate dioxygenase family protein n=1 Tax=unclassified Serratia (in: enterobacteria) TaxID=2647522 RepID=UPI000504A7A8|nr:MULTISPECIES: sugar phosphate isomerase/epimerase and 4-hydroxyphenylpyruvate domain-containing protein [unclassified Serratia (in: enterobacteria)]KFK94399.1 4-hydroxyphenylpyruvate dioxygenase [Serratia sp. Ag2]KFK99476.1 4-hydroxyphenylpyruvate dioxygenase [Serratia sp. Ag1]
MLRSIATVSIAGTLPEKLAAIAAAGFDGVEIFENDLLYFPGKPAEIRQRAQDLGLVITLYQPFRDFEGAPRSLMASNLERARRKFALMHELGCDRMLLCSNVSPTSSGQFEQQVEDLAQLADLAQQQEIVVAYEALAWGQHVKRYRQAWERVKAVDSPALGLALDSFHILALGDTLDRLDDIPQEKIAFLQLADAPWLNMDVIEWSRHFRCFPGQGALPLVDFAAALLRKGYDGPWSLEVFNDGFRAAPSSATAQDGLRSLLLLEEQAQAALGRIEPGIFSSAPLPQRQAIEFLEFAVNAAEADELARWLGQLGFNHCGDHRSKRVALYQNGGVRVVLNQQPDSFAAGYHEQHGASLCAVACRSERPQALLQRAKDFTYPSYQGQVGPNEHEIPALCMPDGSLIYLFSEQTSDVYQDDFRLRPQLAAPEPRLEGVDHLALAMPASALDNWVMFLRSVLGMQADVEQLLPDPYGLVRSKALHTQCNGIRLPLNASQSLDTLSARTVEAYRGSGLQHVAFSTANIFQAVAAARQNGVALLSISDNYYDDLATRFSLDVEFVAQLRQHHILYDRDPAGGELLHVYTQPFTGGCFFFELLERRGGYSQYGVVNGAARLAAMRQG